MTGGDCTSNKWAPHSLLLIGNKYGCSINDILDKQVDRSVGGAQETSVVLFSSKQVPQTRKARQRSKKVYMGKENRKCDAGKDTSCDMDTSEESILPMVKTKTWDETLRKPGWLVFAEGMAPWAMTDSVQVKRKVKESIAPCQVNDGVHAKMENIAPCETNDGVVQSVTSRGTEQRDEEAPVATKGGTTYEPTAKKPVSPVFPEVATGTSNKASSETNAIHRDPGHGVVKSVTSRGAEERRRGSTCCS